MSPSPRNHRSAGTSLFVVAGEVSGDLAAAELIAALRRRDPAVSVIGVGGARMAAAGVMLLEESTTWGVIGHLDPLLRVRTYLRRLARVVAAVNAHRPDVLLLVDFPAFNLRIAERLRATVPIAYYFPPLVTVRKGNRARRVAVLGMRLLATLRREAEAFASAGADVVFVGHPAVDLAHTAPSAGQAREALAVPPHVPVIGLLPGSRLQEVRAHLPILLGAVRLLAREIPTLQVVLPVPAEEIRREVTAIVLQFRERHPEAGSVPSPRIVSEIHTAMRAATLLIAASGTATVEAAVLGIPMVVVYRLPRISWAIGKRLTTIKHVALPNILAGREIVPEVLQERMTPDRVAATAADLLRDEARREHIRDELLQVASTLGEPGAAARAAEEVWRILDRVASEKA